MRSVIAAMLLLAAVVPSPARAQDRTWKLDAEVGANAFFGAAQQTTVHTRGAWEWTTDVWEWSAGGAFDYGETRDPDRGRFVSKRAWTLAGAADYRPKGRFSPFIFASGEGSLKRQIDSRVSGGVGGRYRFIEDDRTRIDVSLAALLERTDSRLDEIGTEEITVNGRWSARLRARRSFSDERLRFDLVSLYKPRVTRFADYTVQVTASAQYALTRIISVKLSLLDTYDSLADDRGAPSNHDGQLLFSVLASIQ